MIILQYHLTAALTGLRPWDTLACCWDVKQPTTNNPDGPVWPRQREAAPATHQMWQWSWWCWPGWRCQVRSEGWPSLWPGTAWKQKYTSSLSYSLISCELLRMTHNNWKGTYLFMQPNRFNRAAASLLRSIQTVFVESIPKLDPLSIFCNWIYSLLEKAILFWKQYSSGHFSPKQIFSLLLLLNIVLIFKSSTMFSNVCSQECFHTCFKSASLNHII